MPRTDPMLTHIQAKLAAGPQASSATDFAPPGDVTDQTSADPLTEIQTAYDDDTDPNHDLAVKLVDQFMKQAKHAGTQP